MKYTRKEIENLANIYKASVKQSKIITPECYYKIGYNYGVYGWNWDAYFNREHTKITIIGNRNFPHEIG